MEQEDENISTLLAMGFPDMLEIKRALRLAKNDLNEAVAILTNEQPLSSYGTMSDLSLDVDMKYSANTDDVNSDINIDNNMEFPVTNLYELDTRVFQDNWSIPYKREESLGKCLVAATRLAGEGLLEQDENCKKFIDRVMPEAFKKLLTSPATHRWQTEIQEGILLMCELYMDLVVTRLQYDPVPCHLLATLSLVLDVKNDWNNKNRDQVARRWEELNTVKQVDYARSPESGSSYNKDSYGWLVDLINMFGDKKGFHAIQEKFEKSEKLSAREMSSLLQPLANCANLILRDTAHTHLSSCMDHAFKYIENLGEQELKSKDINFISDLCSCLKILCSSFWPQHAMDCDKARFDIINRMLKTPHFNCRMNGLKEVSRLIEEAENSRNRQGVSHEAVMEWMSSNKILGVVLEGNIDQVQYTDRIKAIVEFLGPRLSSEELTNIWNLGEGENVQDNVHSIIAAASSKFNLLQFELLNKLIKDKWLKSNDRIREKLLLLIGQIGKEAVNSKQVKPVQAILQLLWDMAHIPEIPKHLVERAFAEHLATINEITINKDAIKKQYVLNCVDDIKKNTHCVLPAVKQLYAICKFYSSKGISMYTKANKQTLSELNKQHEIVKLLSTSLNKAHVKAEEVSRKLGLALKGDTLVDGRYTHKEYVEAHLELMMFLLKEGDLYLSWSRCKELWETLVDNPNSIQLDHDSIFVWFTKCLTDLEPETQKDLFHQKLLTVPPASTSQKSFSCIKAYFENVNEFDQRLKKTNTSNYQVERIELLGMSYFWDVLMETPRDEIAELAVDLVLNMSYLNVTPRLKKEPASLHEKFIKNFYARLESTCQNSDNNSEAVLEGCELEASCVEVKNSLTINSPLPSSTKTLTSVSISKVMGGLTLPNKGLKLQKIRRLLLLAEKYITSIEVLFDGKRTILPHAASFYGRPLTLQVRLESRREEFELESHTNESVGEVRQRIAERLKVEVGKVTVVSVGCGGDVEEVGGNFADTKLLYQLGAETQTWTVKTSSSSTAVVLYEGDASTSSCSKPSSGRQAFELEQEKTLPGVLMAEEGKIFTILYQLAETEDAATIAGVKRLIHLIPTDSTICDSLDLVGYRNPPEAADASPKMSPRVQRINKKMRLPSTDESCLTKLFDAGGTGMNSFRVLYNLEVLSSRIMPNNSNVVSSNANKFAEDFVKSGGLRILLNVLEKDALPLDIDYDIRQSAYFIALQLAGYLLCGQLVVHSTQDSNPVCVSPSPGPISATAKPTPPKKSALDGSAMSESLCKSPLVMSATKFVQTMTESEFVDLISCLMRVVWAAAAGKLYLAAVGIQAAPRPERVYVGRHSRDSSTGSSASTGSDTSTDQALHPGVCSLQSSISRIDCQIAGEALELFVTCLSLRQNLISRFYELPSVSDFIIDTLLGSPSETVRQQAADQFFRLSKIRLVSRSLALSGETNPSSQNSPKHFLIQILLKTPVPLWMPSCKARSASHQLTSQCGEYFSLRCSLLHNMTRLEQELLAALAPGMVEDEISWLFNFSPCHNSSDSVLLAGHIKLLKALLSCQGVDRREVGLAVIPQFISTYLFPASKVISEGGLADSSARDVSPLLDTAEARAAGYSLLIELAKECSANMLLIAAELLSLHHRYDSNLVTEHQFEYEPAIERRAKSNFVGLKNAGATCYMNSVLQQLYTLPGVPDQILALETDSDEESVFYQLQSVFGHLKESKLQHFVPDKFWKCFKLWGQPVNVREQQDAFEFFTQIVDQVDEHLQENKKDKIFSKKFEGIFSDQKICEGCPCRYEREQSFMALNLTVKSNNLQESLTEFVKGEMLEGDNAYFCEKCSVKRNTVKRMCIKSLPQTLVIQLKRFHYDWETNRALKFDDYFEFPWILDMGPYTTEGITAQEDRDKFQSKLSPGLRLNAGGLKEVSYIYDLVGVVVHSGQASAGHYYSFIKERRGNSVTNVNKNKWFKFNDTNVEEFEMTEENLKAECFGGKFKVKKKEGSSLPEERQRYWNGYILFYEARNDHVTPRSPKKSFSGTGTHHRRSGAGSGMMRRLTMPPRISEPGGSGGVKEARESLSQLSDLLEKGEKKGIFSVSRMPPSIERAIREENLRFMQNRDVYSEDYNNFIFDLATVNTYKQRSSDYVQLTVESVKIAVNFLFNTYYHVRRRKRSALVDWADAIHSIITLCSSASQWLVDFLSTEGLKYLKPFLVECNARDVRSNFSHLLEKTVSSQLAHCPTTHQSDLTKEAGKAHIGINIIIENIVEMLSSCLADNVKNSGQYFWLIFMYAQMGTFQCKQLFSLGCFEGCFQFLTGFSLSEDQLEVDRTKQKKWTASQTRELTELHCLLSYLVLACDTSSHVSTECEGKVSKAEELEMPVSVSRLLYGPLAPVFIAETISACREINTSSLTLIIDMLVKISFGNKTVTGVVIEELMKLYSTANSSELKNLSTIIVEMMSITDSLQSDRLKLMIEGPANLGYDGLLNLVQNCQNSDSCRAYQAVKCLVTASSKSAAVKEKLIQDPAKWQHAVNWLKSKMSESSYWSPSSDSIISNEDSSTRTFQRTTSAQVTLDEANAMLAEFDTDKDTAMDTNNDDNQMLDLDAIDP